MMLLSFIAGICFGRWLEILIVRAGLRILKDKGTPIRKYAHENGIPTAPKGTGKVISVKNLEAVNALEKGGTLEEMIDRAGYGTTEDL